MNNQKLDNVIANLKGMMKTDPKGKRPNLSPYSKISSKTIHINEKSSKRLIERVEKAISNQSMLHNSK